MKKILLGFILVFGRLTSFCQVLDFKDSQTLQIDGVEFGYLLGNEQIKNIEGTEYSYYEIQWYVSNKERFSKLFLLDDYKSDGEVNLTKIICLARFDISNALSLNKSEKRCFLKADPNMTIPVLQNAFLFSKKKLLEVFNFKAGAKLENGTGIYLPKGQKPIISVLPFLSRVF